MMFLKKRETHKTFSMTKILSYPSNATLLTLMFSERCGVPPVTLLWSVTKGVSPVMWILTSGEGTTFSLASGKVPLSCVVIGEVGLTFSDVTGEVNTAFSDSIGEVEGLLSEGNSVIKVSFSAVSSKYLHTKYPKNIYIG